MPTEGITLEAIESSRAQLVATQERDNQNAQTKLEKNSTGKPYSFLCGRYDNIDSCWCLHRKFRHFFPPVSGNASGDVSFRQPMTMHWSGYVTCIEPMNKFHDLRRILAPKGF